MAVYNPSGSGNVHLDKALKKISVAIKQPKAKKKGKKHGLGKKARTER